ncbi:MAG: hypothetical protein WC464_02560 [Bdellovibrionales bacterium]
MPFYCGDILIQMSSYEIPDLCRAGGKRALEKPPEEIAAEQAKKRQILDDFARAALPIVKGLEELMVEPGSDFNIILDFVEDKYVVSVNSAKKDIGFRIRFFAEGKVEICRRIGSPETSLLFSDTSIYSETCPCPPQERDLKKIQAVMSAQLEEYGFCSSPAA